MNVGALFMMSVPVKNLPPKFGVDNSLLRTLYCLVKNLQKIYSCYIVFLTNVRWLCEKAQESVHAVIRDSPYHPRCGKLE